MKPNYRRCISCGRLAHRSEFWRVVNLSATQTVQIDQGMGRSAYLCPQEDCLSLAKKKSRLERTLKVSVPQEIYQQLSLRLTQTRPT